MHEKAVLLVDDEEIILNSLGRELAINKFHVTIANSGDQAIVELKERHFDLVVTDLIMGDMDGLQVLKHAKKMDPEICVLIITAYGDMDSAIEALRLGADDYLLKPCNVDDLIFRMGRCLEKQELRKRIKIYEGILPICSVCSKIRDDRGTEHGQGRWMRVDEYLSLTTNVLMSHSYCPECYDKARNDLNQYRKKS